MYLKVGVSGSPGCDVPNESQLPLKEALNDQFRVDFYDGYIGNMGQAIADGGMTELPHNAC